MSAVGMARAVDSVEQTVGLKDTLGSIWAADLPLVERRRLLARTAGARVLGTKCDREAISIFEEALSEVRMVFGKCGIADAIRKLKEAGYSDLSRRLRLASGRPNRKAHPDPGLVAEIRQALRSHQTAGSSVFVLAPERDGAKLELHVQDSRPLDGCGKDVGSGSSAA